MTDRRLDRIRLIATAARGYTVCATSRPDGSVQASLVTAGLFAHPLTGTTCVAFVARGDGVKLRFLRRQPRATMVFRDGHEWVTVEGNATLIGPDDAVPGFDPARVPQLLREIFTAAGGTHDDWPTYDRVMAEERRTAVLIDLDRVYTNPPASR